MTKDPMRLGVVGCGRVFERFHLPAICSSGIWRLEALCDSDPVRRRWTERAAPGTAVFGTLDQMLSEVALEAVLIAAPPAAHLASVERAQQAGVHVLVEKPGGLSAAEARKLADAAKGSGRVVWVGYNRRFRPAYRRLHRILSSTDGARVQQLRFELEVAAAEWGPVSGFLGDPSGGGDVVHDVASHQLDLLSWLFDQPIRSVRARSWVMNEPGLETLAFDVQLANGVVAGCRAQHGDRYRELLVAEAADLTYIAYPTGLAVWGWVRWPAAPDRWAAARYWIDRKLIRLGLLQDEVMLSFRSQINGFGRQIESPSDKPIGADTSAAMQVHLAIEALNEAKFELGGWHPVRG